MATINGTAGDDRLDGTAGDDLLDALAGNDSLYGGEGADTMQGGEGHDDYWVDDAGDQVFEDAVAGIDEVFTTLNGYTLGNFLENLVFVGSGNFQGVGNALPNLLVGGTGDDTLDGGGWEDILIGGAGHDDYYVDHVGDRIFEEALPTIDEVFTTLNSYTLGNFLENLIFTGAGDFQGTGNAISNLLVGGAGNDTLDGGAFDDILWGKGGDDVLIVDNAWDRVWEDAGGGTDEVRTTLAAYTLGTHVENLTALGGGGLAGTGNESANRLAGAAGNDGLSGLGGDDTLAGGAGDNVLTGGAGNDVFVFQAGEGRQTVTDFEAGDRLEVHGLGSAADVLALFVQDGADVVLADGGSALVLVGVDLRDLTTDAIVTV